MGGHIAQKTPIGARVAPLGAHVAPLGAHAAPLGAHAAPLDARAAPLDARAAPLGAHAAQFRLVLFDFEVSIKNVFMCSQNVPLAAAFQAQRTTLKSTNLF